MLLNLLPNKFYVYKCKKALFDKEKKSSDFVNYKDKGGLRHAFKSVIKICSKREKCFQQMLITTSQKLPQCKNVQEGIAAAVLRTIDVKQVFTNLEDHMLDCTVTENHIFLLIKVVAKTYCKIRLYHLGKEKT